MGEVSEYLRGPWQAHLMTFDHHTYADLDAVPEDTDVSIIVTRGSALPVDGRITDDAEERDVLYALSGDDFEDWEEQLFMRWQQALGLVELVEMLNAAAGRSSSEPGA